MAEDHWNEARFGAFVRGELGRAEAKRLMRHLLGGCDQCEITFRPWLEFAGEAMPSPEFDLDVYDSAIDRAFAKVVRAHERREAKTAERVAFEHEMGIGGFRGPALVNEFLRRSFEVRFADRWEMWRLACMARLVADHLDPNYLGAAAVADAQVRAWAEFGNACRLIDDLDEAHESLARAENLLQSGTGDRVLLARVADLRASLAADSRQFQEAVALLGGVFEIYRSLGDLHLAGRALASKGLYLQYAGQPIEARRVLLESLDLLDASRDAQLVVSTRQCLLRAHVEAGEYHEAARLLLRSGLAKDLASEPLNLVRLRWLEGQILAGLGKRSRAESCFLGVRQEFLKRELRYEAGLVGLDLAAVWLDLGRTNESAELAREILGTFRELGVEPEAVRALEFLERACTRAIATSLIVRHVSRFLQRLEHQPELRFQGL